jgi:hypothetical protein
MEGKDDGSFAAVPAPVGGLGNFKGVMLCNRPMDEPTSKMAMAGDEPMPFRSMVSASAGEQLGITPCKTYDQTIKKRGPSAVLRRHVRWLKELQGQMKEERGQVELDEADDAARRQRMKDQFDQHRDDVRKMMADRAKEWVDPARDPEKHKRILEEKAKKKAEKAKSKPLWAMTEQEKEAFEEEEVDDLLNFVEDLDFDKYVGDLEFREGLDALKDRAGKLAKAQGDFKDALVRDFNTKVGDDLEERSTSAGGDMDLEDGLEGASILGDLPAGSEGGRRRSAGRDRYNKDGAEWDSSTTCGDDPITENDRELQDAAEMVLESAPQMRAIHSKGSVQKIIEKTRKKIAEEQAPSNLLEAMERDGPAPVPVITTSQDTQNRLLKPFDPSKLPYLYRSPAV